MFLLVFMVFDYMCFFHSLMAKLAISFDMALSEVPFLCELSYRINDFLLFVGNMEYEIPVFASFR